MAAGMSTGDFLAFTIIGRHTSIELIPANEMAAKLFPLRDRGVQSNNETSSRIRLMTRVRDANCVAA